jgi:O-antigen ligase
MSAPTDAFPHTRRPLPWFLVGFVVVLFVVPIDSTQARLHLPVSAFFDRFVVLIMLVAWVWFGGDQRAILRTPRSKLFFGSAFVFIALAVASILLDSSRLIRLDEFSLATKELMQLASFAVVGWFAATALRYEDVRGFCGFLIGVGTFTALGMIVERETGYNLFYAWSTVILKPIAEVGASPTVIHPAFGTDGRVTVVGPTVHGLAATALLMAIFPLALMRAIDGRSRRAKLGNGLAALLLIVAAAATDRKSALLVPIALLLYIGFYRPRLLVRFAPVWLLLIPVVIHVTDPGALGAIVHPGASASSSSTTHRAGDFAPVLPDINLHPAFGRGYGASDPVGQPAFFRINDDQYVDMLQQVGAVGLIAYIWMILAPLFTARRAIRSGDREMSSLALATSAGCVGFLVVNALFDTMEFPQAPYAFFLLASLSTIASAGPQGNCAPAVGARWRPGMAVPPPARPRRAPQPVRSGPSQSFI